MRIHGTIIGTETPDPWEGEALALLPVGKANFLDWQLKELLSLRKDPIVILGPDGDDFLRASPTLANRRMVFSKSRAAKILEQIQIGLTGAGTCAFFLPLSVPTPLPIVWNELEKVFATLPYNSGPHILQPEIDGRRGFPLLVTPRGKDLIEDLDLDVDLFSLPELEIQTVPVRSETALQQLKNSQDFQDWKSLYTP